MQTNISTQIQQLERQLLESFNPLQDFVHGIEAPKDPQKLSMVSKMQQMMRIFINSLRINQKLYNSIVQKQAKINSGTNSFFDITAQADSKIQDALKRTKQLYEDTVHQNQKARFLLEQFISPIREELRSKVDETTFTLQMKMLLDEYDVMGHQISYDVSEEQKVKQEKRKSVNSETLSFLRDKILPVLSHIEQKIQKNIQSGQVMSTKIQELNTKTRHLQSELNLQREIIQEIQRQNIQRINEKMNEQFIDKKMRETIKFLMNQYSSQLQQSIQKTQKYSKNIQSNLTAQLQQTKSFMTQFASNQKAAQNFLKLKIQKQQNKIQEQGDLLRQKNIELIDMTKKLKVYDESVQFMHKFYNKFENLSSRVEKGEFKSQSLFNGEDYQNLMKRLHEFQIQSKKLKQFQKDSSQKSTILKGELQGIRDILSKKANFSDILLHIEKKVDKQEFKQLKSKLFLTENQEKDPKKQIKNSSFIIKEAQINKSWKKRHIKSKSFFSPSPKQKSSDLDLQAQQVRRFKLGFNHEFYTPNDNFKMQFSKTQYLLRKSLINNTTTNIEQNLTQN